MQPQILFISQKEGRGGAMYEDEIKKVLEKKYKLNLLELSTKKNRIFYFMKIKYYYQIKSYKPFSKFDVLITNKAGVYSGVLSRRFSKKILIFHHYFNEENKYPFLRRFLQNKLLPNLKLFDAVIVVSNYWKKFLAGYMDEKKIHVIYNSFDIEKINSIRNNFDKAAFRKKYNIPTDKIIVYAGNALKVKGYKKVLDQLDANRYFVITSGSKDKDAEINHLHLTLDYTGYIQMLCAVDITVILTMFQEGWNRIAHESLLCRTRVIGCNVAGFGELLQNSKQIIYNEGDNLQQLITTSLSDDSLIENGFKYASQFSMEYLTKETEKFFALNFTQ